MDKIHLEDKWPYMFRGHQIIRTMKDFLELGNLETWIKVIVVIVKIK